MSRQLVEVSPCAVHAPAARIVGGSHKPASGTLNLLWMEKPVEELRLECLPVMVCLATVRELMR